MRIVLGTMMVLLAVAAPAQAQEPINLSVHVTELSQIFTQLYGPEGLVVNSLTPLETGESHSGHFNSGFESEFSQFGTALTGQIVSLPLPPPASGFTFRFDPGLGVFTRTSNSFGPIMSERYETIGGRKFSFGFAHQRLSFDTIEGLDLGRVPAVFTHDHAELLGGREDVITTVNDIDATVTRSATFFRSLGPPSKFSRPPPIWETRSRNSTKRSSSPCSRESCWECSWDPSRLPCRA